MRNMIFAIFFLLCPSPASYNMDDMEKDNNIQDKDVLVRVIRDEECDKLLYEALVETLKKNPVEFYTKFIEPRSGKMREGLGESIFTRMTITQEVALMNTRTSPSKEPADASDEADK